jgi:hypothetical protein
MKTEPQRPKGLEDSISVLNAAIEALDLADKNSSIAPAKSVFVAAGNLFKMIRVRFLLLYGGLVLIRI